MSVSIGGAVSRSRGLISAIAKEVREMNLKGVKRVTITFDPLAKSGNPTR